VGKPILHALALLAKSHQEDEMQAVSAGGEGLVVFQEGYQGYIDLQAQHDAFVALYNCRSTFRLLGGLNSQRDVLEQTLLVLALRAVRMDRTR
jgi:hypothetical protein